MRLFEEISKLAKSIRDNILYSRIIIRELD